MCSTTLTTLKVATPAFYRYLFILLAIAALAFILVTLWVSTKSANILAIVLKPGAYFSVTAKKQDNNEGFYLRHKL